MRLGFVLVLAHVCALGYGQNAEDLEHREDGSLMCTAGLDATILLDQSGSIGASDFAIAKQFATELGSGLLAANRETHVGLIAFGGQTCVILPAVATYGKDSCRDSREAYKSYSTGYPSECKEICQDEKECKAVTHYKESSTCALYRTIATPETRFYEDSTCTYLEIIPGCVNTDVDNIVQLGNHDTAYLTKQIQAIEQPYLSSTPTGLAIDEAVKMIESRGRGNVSQILFLVTDGMPTDERAARRAASIAKGKKFTLATIGVDIKDQTKQLLMDISSEPTNIYANPNIPSYTELLNNIERLIDEQCFYIENISPTCGASGTTIDIVGHNLYSTSDFACVFVNTNDPSQRIEQPAQHVNDSNARCPTDNLPEGTWFVEVTVDGLGITENENAFLVSNNTNVCASMLNQGGGSTNMLNVDEEGLCQELWICILIPLLALLLCLLIPLAYYLSKKTKSKKPAEKGYHVGAPAAPPLQTKAQPVVPPSAAPAAAPEDVELVPKAANPPPEVNDGKYKWQVKSSSYIGFGKGKMDVEWKGDVPESAPHAIKRQKVKDEKGTLRGDPLPQSEQEADDLEANGGRGGNDADVHGRGMHGADYDYEVEGTQQQSWWRRMLCCCCAGKTAKKTPTTAAYAPAASTQAAAMMPTTTPATPVPVLLPKNEDPPAANNSALPPGWEELTTDDGEVYYEHRDNQVTQWERPI